MRKQHLNNGKKLNKKELKSITGGKIVCSTSGGGCAQINTGCIEPQCRPGVTEVCMPLSNTCIKKSFSCVEPPCWPNLEPPIQ